MSNRKISNLPAVIGANIQDTDIIPLVASGVTSSASIAEIRVKLGFNVPGGGRTVTSPTTYFLNNAVANVKDFGAFGDNAHDDRVAVQAAIAATDNVVYFPKGTYVLSRVDAGTAYTLNGKSNLVLQGAGRGLTVLKLADTQLTFTTILKLLNVDNVTIRGITFDGNRANETVGTGQRHGILMDGASNVVIDDCDFINTEGDGLYIGLTNASRNVTVRSSRFGNNGRNGMTLGGSNGVRIQNCYFGSDIAASPIDSEPNTVTTINTVVVSNVFESNGQYGISFQGVSDAVPSENWTVSNNVFLGQALFMNRVKKAVVSNNVIIWNSSAVGIPAIEVKGVATDIEIANNYIETDQFGVYAYTNAGFTPDGVRIVGNTIVAVKESVRLLGVRNVGVIGNKLSGNGTNNVILLQAANADNINTQVIGNTLRNGNQIGIAITRSAANVHTGLVISNNIFDDDQGVATMLYGIRSLVNADYIGIPVFSNNITRASVSVAMSLPFTTQIFIMSGDRERAVYSLGGSPEGVVTASIGSLALVRDGLSGTTLFVKESGAGNTGWIAYGPTQRSANNATWVYGQASELLVLSTVGATTDTVANLLPAGAIIEAVVARVTTTITTATDWKLGDATTAARFTNANAVMTAGTTGTGLNHQQGSVATDAAGPVQVAAAKVRVTTTGTPGAGAIRITVFYRQLVAPTS